MSIYCTFFDFGMEHGFRCKRMRRIKRDIYEQDDSKPCTCKNSPLKYQGSQVLPASRDERGGSLDLGAIPSHITRNGRDNAPDGFWHPWLRVSLSGVGTDTIVLTKPQVKDLRDALTNWLAEAGESNTEARQ